jgi:hypothetical protein
MFKILELEESHLAFRWIKNLIEKPSSEGTQLLHFAAVEFQNFLSRKSNKIDKIKFILVCAIIGYFVSIKQKAKCSFI